MSKTKRKIIDYNYNQLPKEIVADDNYIKFRKHKWNKEKKLRPYMRGDVPYKHKFEVGEKRRLGKYRMRNNRRGTKIENNNANRSLKKGIRQQLKSELVKELQTT